MSRTLIYWTVIVGLLLAGEAQAGSVFVTTANPRTGTRHARVDVGRSCATDHLTVPPGSLVGDQTFRACSTLSATGVEVASGATRLEAGDRVALGSGFSVASGASLVVRTGSLARGEGIIENRAPDGATDYHARFFLDPTALDLLDGERFEHFVALDAGGARELVLGIRRGAGSNRLFLATFADDGGLLSTESTDELVLLPGWHAVEISWQASSGANDGRAEACLDAEPGAASRCLVLSGLDNDTGRIDAILWGAQDTPRGGMGLLDLDDFASWGGQP